MVRSAMDTAQQFTLGSLVSSSGTTYPGEVALEIQGRGIFCRVCLEFSFSPSNEEEARLFTIERPWNAVLSSVAINGDEIGSSTVPTDPVALPAAMKPAVQEAFQDGKPEIISLFFEPGKSLRTIQLTFTMACDVLWHKSSLAFVGVAGSVKLPVRVNWDLSGLPGASVECSGDVSDYRFSSLDGSRQQWNEEVTLSRGDILGITLSLDEKKAASICLFTEGPKDEPGCGAVVVVAPVRPQLLRKPVRIAVVVEVRNPQEGLATRDLVDQLSSTLNPTDQISIFFMGSTVSRKLLDWKQAGDVQEDDLGQLLDPALMGRAGYFWESLQRVLEDCQDATHILLVTPGPKVSSPDDLVCRLPVFCFASGRKPNACVLDEFAGRTGGFMSEQAVDGVESFLQRILIRLSPPLLRDFRLEGWGLEKEYPPGVTQVYTDKPTLVLGLYEGLLPQTVTLGGFSPAGQKLAQRVRVEDFSDFSLMPLFEERSRPHSVESGAVKREWAADGVRGVEATRPVPLTDIFLVEESDDGGGHDAFAPPAIDMVNTAVSFEEPEPAEQPSSDTFSGDMFSKDDSGSTLSDDFFSGADEQLGFGNADSMFGEEPLFDDDIDLGGSGFFDETPSTEEPLDPSSESFERDESATIMERPSRREKSTEGPASEERPPSSEGPPSEERQPSTEGRPSEEIHASQEPPSSEPFPSSESPSSMGDSQEEDLFDGPAPSGYESFEEADEPEPFSSGERETVDVVQDSLDERSTIAYNLEIPEWVKRLSDLENEAMRTWLCECPIDALGLALADTDRSLADTFLSKLEGPRKFAVETQMEMGRLLPVEERREATTLLENRLN